MVNFVAAQMPFLRALMKMAGVMPYSVEIEPGTVMKFWIPVETLPKHKKGQQPNPVQRPTKPVVVLIHGFAAEGIVTWQFQVMFNNRKDRKELLEDLIISDKSKTVPKFTQKIHLLWGENDQMFTVELAQKLKEELGDNATFRGIPKAGHLVQLERPCVYNRCLKNFLASLHSNAQTK